MRLWQRLAPIILVTTVIIQAVTPPSRDTNIQKITVTVQRNDKDLFSLVGYKENAR